MKTAKLGSISHGTMRTEDLLPCFASKLEGLIFINGDYFANPENFKARNRLNNLIGESQDAWNEGGNELENPENASELLDELFDALNEFAPPYGYFGSNEGNGADYGFWPDIDSAKESVEFVSVKSHADARKLGIETNADDSCFPPDDFRGEWLHVTDHGNVTLYVRENNTTDAFAKDGYVDREIWAIV